MHPVLLRMCRAVKPCWRSHSDRNPHASFHVSSCSFIVDLTGITVQPPAPGRSKKPPSSATQSALSPSSSSRVSSPIFTGSRNSGSRCCARSQRSMIPAVLTCNSSMATSRSVESHRGANRTSKAARATSSSGHDSTTCVTVSGACPQRQSGVNTFGTLREKRNALSPILPVHRTGIWRLQFPKFYQYLKAVPISSSSWKK